nr:TPA_asm: ND5 [Bombus nevadensis]
MMKMLICGLFLLMMSMIFMFFGLYLLLINKMIVLEWMIFSLNSLKFNFFLILNFKLLMFMFLVMFITSMILIYSISYMDLNNNFFIKRFYYLMLLFLISMIFLILSPNMLTLLLGWDGLGLISYCLIIYYQKMKSFNSGLLTIILNRLGDTSLLMMISLMMIFGSWNLILYKMDFLMILLLLLMVFTKSAQLMFMIWLPAAMMAPTPVSSLVHSSTLVTAGVYLLIIYESLINYKFKEYILLISSMTMLISGLMANFEMDFKKIIALSTLSQLGFMLSILSLGMVNLTFLHLFIHAFFKSMMFMCVGSFIHYLMGIQNIRFYNGVFYIYPMKSLLIMFSLLMLCGFPFLVGFYSKDLIIEYYFLNNMSIFSLMNLIVGTIFTVSYSFRIMFFLMKDNLMINLINMEEDLVMIYCMIFMILVMLFLSKFFFNLFFFYINLNLVIIYKYFVFKMMLIGIINSLYLMKLNFNKNMILFIKSFFYIEYLYKVIINYMLYKFINYDLFFEKGLIEMLMGKFMNFLIMLFKMMNLKFNIFYLLILYMYLYMIILLMF